MLICKGAPRAPFVFISIFMAKKVFIFFGRSGSGKGTQAELLIDYLKEKESDRKVIYIETGQEFREFIQRDNFTSNQVKKILNDGGLLPGFLPIWIWTSALVREYTGDNNIVFDGISRRAPEAPVVDGALDFYNFEERYIVHLNVSNEWSKKRMLGRGRYDDNEDDIANRLSWYEENVAPVVEIFRKNDKYTFLDINGEQSIDDVHKAIISAING